MTATLLILSVFTSAVPQPALRTFLARRDYDSAVQYYRTRLLREVVDVADMRDLARVYDHWHKFDSSLAWWDRVLEHHPDDDSAIDGRWSALYNRDQKDSLKLVATKKQIASEVSAFLAETTARSLTLAWDGLSLSDTSLAPRVGWLLMERFPFSPRKTHVRRDSTAGTG